MQNRIFTSDSYALDWAKSHLRFESSELISEAPWARTYKLTGQGGGAYLKLLPPAMSTAPGTTSELARRFPRNLPKVISRDDELGLLLFQRHRGRRLDSAATIEERRKLLQDYAALQAKFRQQSDLLALFPTIDVTTLVPSLLNFLDPARPRADTGGKVGAVYYMGRTRARRYNDPLAKRAKLIDKYINAAGGLPATINHCDLRLKNVKLAPDDSIVLSNWDDATVGPAGLSLHALFGGCATPAALLSNNAASASIDNPNRERYILDAYIETLADSGYAARDELGRCLPGSICAGAIHDLLRYADYPHDSRSYRRRVRRILEKRLSDLLDFCDLVALRDLDLGLRSAFDYQENKRPWRAETLLRKILAADRNNPQAHSQLARVLHAQGKRREATAAYREAIELNPHHADLLTGYGKVLLEDLRFEEAITAFRKALQIGDAPQDLEANLDRTCQLRDCERDAKRSSRMPTLPVSAAERQSGKLRPESLALGAKMFNKYGTLLIENAFDADLIKSCDEYFLAEYKDYFGDEKRPDALPIGDRRLQITFALEGPFNNPDLYANPFVLELMKRLLGRKFFLGCTVCATSMPGSQDQHLHKDHRALFTSSANDTPMFTPPFAITTMVPLVRLDEMSGTTTVRKGSHLVSRRKSAGLPRQAPIVPVGSCFLMDLRLSHQGLGNKTNRVRPILNMVYQQPWFADNKNYEKQPPLRIPADEFGKIPKRLRGMFRWAIQPGPDVQ